VGARLLALQGDDGPWEGGALFPARRGDSDAGDRSADGDRSEDSGQPWTATAYSLVLLRDLGVDPRCDQVRRAVTLVRDNCRWEHAGHLLQRRGRAVHQRDGHRPRYLL
jgi:hypothetical protein